MVYFDAQDMHSQELTLNFFKSKQHVVKVKLGNCRVCQYNYRTSTNMYLCFWWFLKEYYGLEIALHCNEKILYGSVKKKLQKNYGSRTTCNFFSNHVILTEN